jgi:hypothetical protein
MPGVDLRRRPPMPSANWTPITRGGSWDRGRLPRVRWLPGAREARQTAEDQSVAAVPVQVTGEDDEDPRRKGRTTPGGAREIRRRPDRAGGPFRTGPKHEVRTKLWALGIRSAHRGDSPAGGRIPPEAPRQRTKSSVEPTRSQNTTLMPTWDRSGVTGARAVRTVPSGDRSPLPTMGTVNDRRPSASAGREADDRLPLPSWIPMSFLVSLQGVSGERKAGAATRRSRVVWTDPRTSA